MSNGRRDDKRERRLLKAVARGNRRAFEALYDRFERPLLAYFLRLVGSRDVAEELVSDTLFEVWRSASNYEGRSKASTWLFGIAHHKGIDRLRRSPPHTTELDERAPDHAAGPDATAQGHETAVAMRSALSSLPESQRSVVHLAFYQDLSYREIARICSIPEGTVKTRMYHAKRRLQPLLEQMGITP